MEDRLNSEEGKTLRDNGMAQSLETAENTHEKWGEKAYRFLVEYTRTNKVFMAEDVRIASINKIPEPPSDRAWGSIFVMAKKNGLIYSKGFSYVKNPKAHRTPATLWGVK